MPGSGIETAPLLSRSVKTCLVLILLLAWPSSGDWPQWRGPARDGISAETGLLEAWPAGGPPLVWKTQGLGEGFSSFSVSDGRLFTQGQRNGGQYVIALDEGTGEKLWETPNGESFHERRGGGPRGTPTVEGDRVYAVAANGNLICLRAADGKRIWSTKLLDRFGASNIKWGISESPLIDGKRLIVNPGGKGASVVALDKNNGNVIWKSQSDRAGYSSAVAADIAGIRQYIVLTGNGVLGLRANDGGLLWRYDEISNRTANVATPIVKGDSVFVSTDYGTGCALLKLEAAGGGIRASEVYFNRDMRNHYGTSVLVGDHLYGFSSRILTAMDFRTGEVAWKDRSVGKGQVAYAEGKLYIFSEEGVVGLAEATPEGYREISRFSIEHGDLRTWTQPVIANGKLYLRDQDTVSCYDIRAR
jgi:outer membrane protein assembly factor BamB